MHWRIYNDEDDISSYTSVVVAVELHGVRKKAVLMDWDDNGNEVEVDYFSV